jgi:anti-sigma-K factor RskA
MNYQNDQLRDVLAAQYVLGTLQGPARRQFERRLALDPALRREVAGWQERLAPLNLAVQPVQPPARVWRKIQLRLGPASRSAGGLARLWESLGFWRGAAFASSLAALVLAAYLSVVIPAAQQREMMVVVMADDQSTPAMTISWRTEGRGERQMRVRVIGHQVMDPDTAWELWMLPGREQKPVSLGLITTHETQTVAVPARLVPMFDRAWGLAMSVEPKGGSPTGLPTGPVLYKGQCTKL